MISGTNMPQEHFLSVGKIGYEGPSTILEDLENSLEFVISADFHN